MGCLLSQILPFKCLHAWHISGSASDGSTHDRFCHEDIWLAQPIGIWHYAHNHIALLLVKLVGMPREIPDVGHVFPDMGIEIDPRQGGLSSDVIGAKGNGQ